MIGVIALHSDDGEMIDEPIAVRSSIAQVLYYYHCYYCYYCYFYYYYYIVIIIIIIILKNDVLLLLPL